jgi:hypothetical protein
VQLVEPLVAYPLGEALQQGLIPWQAHLHVSTSQPSGCATTSHLCPVCSHLIRVWQHSDVLAVLLPVRQAWVGVHACGHPEHHPMAATDSSNKSKPATVPGINFTDCVTAESWQPALAAPRC